MTARASDFADLARAFAAIVERIAADADEPGQGDWLDQHHSTMGPRQHIAAVRRRMAEGKPGASHPERDVYLLTKQALDEELQRCPKPGLRKTTPASVRACAERAILDKLRRVRNPKD